jgi:hypothetical protein
MVEYAHDMIQGTLGMRKVCPRAPVETAKIKYYIDQYERSTVVDVAILPYLDQTTADELSTEHLQKLLRLVEGMLEYQPFELVTIHDAFLAHPNNLNHVRKQYANILADLADSELLSDLFSQIHGQPMKFSKLSQNLGEVIRTSNYSLS